MSRLIAFYRGEGTDAEGRTLADLWAFSDPEMEEVHDFIQWLFPLRERSRFNPNAPLLTDADIAEFLGDPALRASLLRSFEKYLGFLGLRFREGRVEKAADFAGKNVFQAPDHNWLRITRVLASTRMLGLEQESRAFFAFLKAYREGEPSGITDEAFRYWRDAAAGA